MKATKIKSVPVRLPAELYEMAKRLCEKKHLSFNGYVNTLLEADILGMTDKKIREEITKPLPMERPYLDAPYAELLAYHESLDGHERAQFRYDVKAFDAAAAAKLLEAERARARRNADIADGLV